ncbi:MAG: hypothetical protein HKO57_08570 [Akkermansiaceae bacterium]|nr:hypothetical protein [Akkermansiaceae bacterium]
MAVLAGGAGDLRAQNALQPQLEATYNHWRDAMVRKSGAAWKAHTSARRQAEVRNRILSERAAFPGAVFEIPAAPPALAGLRALQVTAKGATAKAVYFGKVDFGVGASPPDNLLVLSFVNERGGWKYDGAEFINLAAMPDVRAKLRSGDISPLKTPEFLPSGQPAPVPIQVQGPAKYISKVYVYCPGREVQVMVNKISRHTFANTKEAEVVIGGARDGANEIQFTVKALPGSEGNEPMTIRVYLFSEIQGVNPVKAFEYQVAEGGKPKAFDTRNFQVTPAIVAKLRGK